MPCFNLIKRNILGGTPWSWSLWIILKLWMIILKPNDTKRDIKRDQISISKVYFCPKNLTACTYPPKPSHRASRQVGLITLTNGASFLPLCSLWSPHNNKSGSWFCIAHCSVEWRPRHNTLHQSSASVSISMTKFTFHDNFYLCQYKI